jgi:hypothetical protein
MPILPLALCALTLATSANAAETSPPPRKTENVFLVLLDGVRWREVFNGADRELLQSGSIGMEERRKALMPFLWSVTAESGRIYGNKEAGNSVKVTNGFFTSYPGYNEALSGYPDQRISGNDPIPNPNVTVLEWLHRKARFQGKIAAFGAWGYVPAILNRDRCGFLVVGGVEPVENGRVSDRQRFLNEIKANFLQPLGPAPFDTMNYFSAREFIKAERPKVFFLSFIQTDTYAHESKYSLTLGAIRRADRFLEGLWKTLQAIPQYRGKTSMIVTTDHGRGEAERWVTHGAAIQGSDDAWIAIFGPDTPPAGEVKTRQTLVLGQVAATIAALLGEDYRAAAPSAAPPIWDAIAWLERSAMP